MTDAREIIANTRVDDGDPIGLTHANAIVVMLLAAGYRVIGPDEVDPVTLEKCAVIAKEQAEEEDGAEGFLACKTLEDAIRALGRKA